MLRLLIQLGLTAILALVLVVHALTEWAVAAWGALVTALAAAIFGGLFWLWPSGDSDDIDADI